MFKTTIIDGKPAILITEDDVKMWLKWNAEAQFGELKAKEMYAIIEQNCKEGAELPAYLLDDLMMGVLRRSSQLA